MIEKILQENPNRFTLLPIQYPEIWKLYKEMQATVWFVEELSFSDDLKDWAKMTESEKHFVKMILAFFASADAIVNENICQNFATEIQIPEARAVYSFQIMMEQVHSETYALLIDSYIKDPIEKDKLFRAIHTIECVKKKSDWAMKFINNKNKSFATRLVGFACVECIQFSSSFCAIFYLKTRNLLTKGLGVSNNFISRDEAGHVRFACLLYSMLDYKLDSSEVYEIVSECVNLEKEFASDALPVSLIGMNCVEMCKYIEFVGDYLLVLLGYQKIYKTENPFNFMMMLSLNSKENFFEQTVSQYNKAGFVGTKEENMFQTDADF